VPKLTYHFAKDVELDLLYSFETRADRDRWVRQGAGRAKVRAFGATSEALLLVWIEGTRWTSHLGEVGT